MNKENIVEKTYLSAEDILNAIGELSASQGFYGRLYNDITESEDNYKEFEKMCNKQKFQDVVDFVMFIEG